MLLDLAAVETAPALNSFFESRSIQAAQTKLALDLMLAINPADKLVLVTHQVNVTALTGVFPTSGEVVVVSIKRAKGTLAVEARIRV